MGSLQACRRLVDALNQELLLFDFKNGPLRVKYDSVKCVPPLGLRFAVRGSAI